MGEDRTVLLLQGPSSLFFSRLGDALAARGARVLRVHLCPGDVLFWRRGGGRSYRGRLADWPAWLEAFAAAEGVDDLVLLGDRRPFHHPAAEAARRAGIRVHHVELGYLRPDRLTVEPDGGGAGSGFPRDWARLEALAEGADAPEAGRRWRSSFRDYAAMDVAWNLSNLALAWLTHPGYRRHATWHPLVEYAGFLRKWSRPGRARRAARAQAWALEGGPEGGSEGAGPLFLLPLQLATDFQIRAHGPDADLRVTARRAVRSFAAHAPQGARLLVKIHPMDNGWTPWRRLLRAEAARAGAEGRVEVIEGGDLDALIAAAAGVVTVNSTVGLAALQAGRPVKCLGRALFDLEGMTDPQPLEAFWQAPRPPDPARVEIWLRALNATVLVPGNFDGEGAGPGAENVAERILSPRLPFRGAPAP